MLVQFNPPPGWPAPPPGWVPEDGWRPDPSWPDPPPGWRFWSTHDDSTGAVSQIPVAVQGPAAAEDASPAGGSLLRSLPTRVKVGWGIVTLVIIGMGLSSGLDGALTGVLGCLFFTGLWALVVGRARWAGLRTRGMGALALVAAFLLAPLVPSDVGSGAGSPASQESSTSTVATSTPTSAPSAQPVDPVEEALDEAARGTALRVLATLPVKPAQGEGYQRSAFGQAWADVDRNGCDTRNDILRRDLNDTTLKAGTGGCAVMTGRLHDPYTGDTVHYNRAKSRTEDVEVDHVVALQNAWSTGAAEWTARKRERFANDPLNLLAVSADANQEKGSADAAGWLPHRQSYWCAYVARQIAVKAKYDEWVTPDERAAMVDVLSDCADRRPPTARPVPLGGAPVYVAPAPAGEQPHVDLPTVHPGAFCEPLGARGVTIRGTPMKCSLKVGDPRARWRAA